MVREVTYTNSNSRKYIFHPLPDFRQALVFKRVAMADLALDVSSIFCVQSFWCDTSFYNGCLRVVRGVWQEWGGFMRRDMLVGWEIRRHCGGVGMACMQRRDAGYCSRHGGV